MPTNEKKGRRHSSSVSVAILDQNESRSFEFDQDDVEIQVARGSGKGGQKRNKTETAVVAVHRPTGKRVRIDSRSQGQNKRNAMSELERRLFETEEFKAAVAENVKRISQIENDRTFNWCGWRDEALNHATGRRTSMAKALKGKLDPLLD